MSDLATELQHHAGALRALALRLVGAAHADDLVQETSLIAWQRPPARAEGLGTWLRAVLRHRASKLRRAEGRRRYREQAAATTATAATAPVEGIVHRESVMRLHAALMALPEPYQGVLLQRFFQDLLPTAIAAANGTPVATVKSQLQRGLTLLRERLDAEPRERGDWRRALAGAFALPIGARGGAALASTAGVLLMTTTMKVGLGLLAAAALLVLWPRRDPAPGLPQAGTNVDALATSATAAPARSAREADGAQQRQAVPAAAASAAPPIRLRIVDARSGDGVPDYAVRLAPDADDLTVGETMLTNAAGELVLAGTQRGRPLTIVGLDHPDGPGDQHHAIAADGWPDGDSRRDVLFAVGPTYRLLFDTIPPTLALSAALIPGLDPRHGLGSSQGQVRAGPLPWVRLDPLAASASRLGAGPHMLVVFGSDPHWFACGQVATSRGVQAEPVVMRTVACGSLAVHLTVAGKTMDEGGYFVSLYELVGGKPHGVDFTKHFTKGSGRERFEYLRAGTYRVFLNGPGEQVHQQDVAVTAGALAEVHHDFPVAAALHTLEVRARSETGTRNLFVLSFMAKEVGGKGFASAIPVKMDERCPDYRFEGLADGEWDIELEPTPHLPPWRTLRQRVAANAGSVEFLCLDRDAPPAGHVEVLVTDATTGKAIAGAGVTSFVAGTQHVGTMTDLDGRAELSPYVSGQPIQVLVCAADCLPAFVTATPRAEPDAPPLRVAMHSGWGTMLVVRRASTETIRGTPLAGVQVALDGSVIGATDEQGLLLLTSAVRPTRIDLRHPRFVLDYGSIDPQTGAPDNDATGSYFVVMKPRQ